MRAVCIEREVQTRNRVLEKENRYKKLKDAVKKYQKEYDKAKNMYERTLLQMEQEEVFARNVRELFLFLSEERRWEELVAYCEQVQRYCPREEWSWDQIEALLNMECYEEARAAHQRSMKEFFSEGQNYSVERKNAFLWLGELIERIESTLKEREIPLIGSGEIGANQCSPGDFADLLHYNIRNRQGGYLMICTLQEREGKAPVADTQHTYEQMYGRVLQKALRKKDYYTINGGGQVQILLPNLGSEAVDSVTDRLKKRFRQASRGKGEVQIQSLDISGWIEKVEGGRI